VPDRRLPAEIRQEGEVNIAIGDVSDSGIVISSARRLLARDVPIPGRSSVEPSPDALRRSSLFAALDQLMASHASGALIVEGTSGTGKSTSVRQLLEAGTPGADVVAVNAADIGGESATLSLWSQLAQVHRKDQELPGLPGIEMPVVRLGVRSELGRLAAAGRSVVILIDGPRDPAQFARWDYLGLPENLPAGVYVVVTSRPGIEPPERWPTVAVTLDSSSAARDELQEFISSRLAAFDNLSQAVQRIQDLVGPSWLLADIATRYFVEVGDVDEAARFASPDVRVSLARVMAHQLRAIPGDLRFEELELIGFLAQSHGPIPLDIVKRALAIDRALLGTHPVVGLIETSQGHVLVDLKHQLLRDVVLDPPSGLLQSEARDLARAADSGTDLLRALASASFDESGDQEYLAAALGTVVTAGVLSGRSAAVSERLAAHFDAATSASMPAPPVALRLTLTSVWDRVARLAVSDRIVDRLVALAHVGLLVSSQLGSIRSLEPAVLGTLLARGAIDSEEFTAVISMTSSEDKLAAVTAMLEGPRADLGVVAGWADVMRSPARPGPARPLAVTRTLVELLNDDSSRVRSAAIEALSGQRPAGVRWIDFAESERTPLLAARLCALALSTGSDHGRARACGAAAIVRLNGIQRVRALVELFAADPDHALWREALAEELTAARLADDGATSTRVLLEIAAVAPRLLSVSLADEAIESARRSRSRLWKALVALALPLASPAGVRAALAEAMERLTATDAAVLCSVVATNPDPAAIGVSLAMAAELPIQVRGLASIPLRRALQGQDDQEGASLDEFEALESWAKFAVMAPLPPPGDLREAMRRAGGEAKRSYDQLLYSMAFADDHTAEVTLTLDEVAADRNLGYLPALRAAYARVASRSSLEVFVDGLRLHNDGAGNVRPLLSIASALPHDAELEAVFDSLLGASGPTEVMTVLAQDWRSSWTDSAFAEFIDACDAQPLRKLAMWELLGSRPPGHEEAPRRELAAALAAGTQVPGPVIAAWGDSELLSRYAHTATNVSERVGWLTVEARQDPGADFSSRALDLARTLAEGMTGSPAESIEQRARDHMTLIAEMLNDHDFESLWSRSIQDLEDRRSPYVAVSLLETACRRGIEGAFQQLVAGIPEDDHFIVDQAIADLSVSGRALLIDDLLRSNDYEPPAELLSLIAREATNPLVVEQATALALRALDAASPPAVRRAGANLWPIAASQFARWLRRASDDRAMVLEACERCGLGGAAGRAWALEAAPLFERPEERGRVLSEGLAAASDDCDPLWASLIQEGRDMPRSDFLHLVAGVASTGVAQLWTPLLRAFVFSSLDVMRVFP
jgi:hypothetical protein